ncbi:fasciclin domain-containing protein [Halorarius litoreus]|uniref:fasciclin domain-containing protein n=1 Tax=Halorarius litoreus TaxID=2962676 RepID=UPI0020CCA97D|nr:fasciclin domain-containing protein [Halorarius litoreus]
MAGHYPRRHVLKAIGGTGAFLALGGTASARNGQRQGASGGQSIVELALEENAASGEFSTLIAALAATDLVDALNGRTQLTAFAPTDAAFANIGLTETSFENFTRAELEELTDVLLYHVTRGRRYAASLNDGAEVEMLNGDATTVEVVGNNVFLNASQVIGADTEASNGVLHVINAVLEPPA